MRILKVISKNDFEIQDNWSGIWRQTNREELRDMGKRYNLHEMGEEFGISYLSMWRILKILRIKKAYVRKAG